MRLTLLSLTAVAGVVGLWLGLQRVNLTEGDVILHYAQIYATETGGVITDCHGEPFDQGWLTVICRGAGGERQFFVGHRGQLLPTPNRDLGA